MGTVKQEYIKCPKCGLNYITGNQRMCSVCISESRAYRGKYCSECGGKSGQYSLCYACYKAQGLSLNERRVMAGYRTDNGMLGSRVNQVCGICGAPSKTGHLCGRCYASIVYGRDEADST